MEIARFANPNMLWLLLLLLPMVGYYIWRNRRGGASIRISTISGISDAKHTLRYYLRHLPAVLRLFAIALFVVALARPQNAQSNSTASTQGIDIVLSLDISGSMLARDFDPDRLTAAKEMASRFVADRNNDRIGLVVFAGESFTQCPLTTDKRMLLNLMSQVRSGIVEDGTAIGDGLATAVNRLKDSQAKSKVIILLTDGVNNRGRMAPLTAADAAQAYGIKVYTIGVGTRGKAPSPAIDMWGNMIFVPQDVEIDEDVLTQISSRTGGEYFRATDNKSLQHVYDKINELERSKIEINDFTRYNELFVLFLSLGIIILSIEFLTKYLFIRQIP